MRAWSCWLTLLCLTAGLRAQEDDSKHVPVTVALGTDRLANYRFADRPMRLHSSVGEIDLWFHDLQSIERRRGQSLYTVRALNGDTWICGIRNENFEYLYQKGAKQADISKWPFVRISTFATMPEGNVGHGEARFVLQDGTSVTVDARDIFLPYENECVQGKLPLGSIRRLSISADDSGKQLLAALEFPSGCLENVLLAGRKPYFAAQDRFGNSLKVYYEQVAYFECRSGIADVTHAAGRTPAGHSTVRVISDDGRIESFPAPMQVWEVGTEAGDVLLPSAVIKEILYAPEGGQSPVLTTVYGERFIGRVSPGTARFIDADGDCVKIRVDRQRALRFDAPELLLPAEWLTWRLKSGDMFCARLATDEIDLTLATPEGGRIRVPEGQITFLRSGDPACIVLRDETIRMVHPVERYAEIVLLDNSRVHRLPWKLVDYAVAGIARISDEMWAATQVASEDAGDGERPTPTTTRPGAAGMAPPVDLESPIAPAVPDGDIGGAWTDRLDRASVDLQQTVARLDRVLDSLEDERGARGPSREELSAEIERLRARLWKLQEQEAENKRALEQARKAEAEAEKDAGKHEQELRNRSEELQQAQEASEARVKEMEQEIERQKRLYDELSARHEDAVKALEAENEELRRNLAEPAAQPAMSPPPPPEPEPPPAVVEAVPAVEEPVEEAPAPEAPVARIVPSDGTLPEQILMPGGTFLMGRMGGPGPENELPSHGVTVRAFLVDPHEATRRQFAEFALQTGYKTKAELDQKEKTWRSPGFEQKPDEPVVYVTWYDAAHYCNWLSRKTGLQPCYESGKDKAVLCFRDRTGFRLPTEAEWEYAARCAGKEFIYPWGNEASPAEMADRANFSQAADEPQDGWEWTNPVQAFPPSECGLYGMAGNVWEWCQDRYVPDAYVALHKTGSDDPCADDPREAERSVNRVMRGGSFLNGLSQLRCRARGYGHPHAHAGRVGFRTVRTATELGE